MSLPVEEMSEDWDLPNLLATYWHDGSGDWAAPLDLQPLTNENINWVESFIKFAIMDHVVWKPGEIEMMTEERWAVFFNKMREGGNNGIVLVMKARICTWLDVRYGLYQWQFFQCFCRELSDYLQKNFYKYENDEDNLFDIDWAEAVHHLAGVKVAYPDSQDDPNPMNVIRAIFDRRISYEEIPRPFPSGSGLGSFFEYE
ncbi:hypothetical protein HYALB_00005598 [Hymenoscyphus albidus]|uniref:Uncharacterized protein n=1 Tax=Hymenoscyphus albidus TaxID=595503 RepID=A0A9N9LJT7_9HELO|nr:hypothetical protein HYALB_00005598 [Hymenoscyphus albidus]